MHSAGQMTVPVERDVRRAVTKRGTILRRNVEAIEPTLAKPSEVVYLVDLRSLAISDLLRQSRSQTQHPIQNDRVSTATTSWRSK